MVGEKIIFLIVVVLNKSTELQKKCKNLVVLQLDTPRSTNGVPGRDDLKKKGQEEKWRGG